MDWPVALAQVSPVIGRRAAGVMAWGLWLVIAALVRLNASGGLTTREFRLKGAELLRRV